MGLIIHHVVQERKREQNIYICVLLLGNTKYQLWLNIDAKKWWIGASIIVDYWKLKYSQNDMQ